jgi:hypothetical protein
MSRQPSPKSSAAIVITVLIAAMMPSIAEARSPVKRGIIIQRDPDHLLPEKEEGIEGGIVYPECPKHQRVRRDAEVLGLVLTQLDQDSEMFVRVFRDYRTDKSGIMKVRLPEKTQVQTGDLYLISGAMTLGVLHAHKCSGWTVFRGDPDAPHEDKRSEKLIKTYGPQVIKWAMDGTCPATGTSYRVFINEVGKVSSEDACLTSKIPNDLKVEPPVGGPAELIIRLEAGADPEVSVGPGKFSRSGFWHELTNPDYFKKESSEESFLRLKLGQETPANKSDAVRFLCEGYGVEEAEAFFTKRVPRTDEDANLEMVLCALNHGESEVAGRYVDHVGIKRVVWLREVIRHSAAKKALADTGWTADDYLQKLAASGVDYSSCAVLLEWLAEALVARTGAKPEDNLLAALALYRAETVSPSMDVKRIRQARKLSPETSADTLPKWTPRGIKFGVPQFGREIQKGPELAELRELVARMDQGVVAVKTPTTDSLPAPPVDRAAIAEAIAQAEAANESKTKDFYYWVVAGLVTAALGTGFLFGRKF